jgi:carbon starvation protein CstA
MLKSTGKYYLAVYNKHRDIHVFSLLAYGAVWAAAPVLVLFYDPTTVFYYSMAVTLTIFIGCLFLAPRRPIQGQTIVSALLSLLVFGASAWGAWSVGKHAFTPKAIETDGMKDALLIIIFFVCVCQLTGFGARLSKEQH